MPPENRVRTLLAANLKRARLNQGWSQLALAQRAGTAHTVINDIEHGKKWLSPEKLDALCEALGIEPYQMFVPPQSPEVAKDEVVAAMSDELKIRVSGLLDEVRTKFLGQ